MEKFPLPAPPHRGDCRTVPAGYAFEWFKQAWAIFVAAPGVWVAISFIFCLLILGVSLIPVLGGLAAQILLPVLIAGAMLACQKAEDGELVEIVDLFAGFKRNTNNLLLLGVFYVLGMSAIFAVAMVSSSGVLLADDPGRFAFGGLVLGVVLVLTLSLLLYMAAWFAPALVVFNDIPPLQALMASLNACLKNTMVFLVYGFLTLVFAFLATLPVGLGWLVFGPVLLASIYVSYRDIFVAT